MLELQNLDQTKLGETQARPDDKFELVGSATMDLIKLRQEVGDPTKTQFTRAELNLAKLNIRGMTLARTLRPLQDSSPEEYGVTIEELFDKAIPATKDMAKKFAGLFRFVEDPRSVCPEAALCLTASKSDYLLRFAYDRYRQELVPAALLVIAETAFRHSNNAREQVAQQLAQRLLLTVPAETYQGKGAASGVAYLVNHLAELGGNDLPRCGGDVAEKLLKIIAVNKPLSPDLRLPFLKAARLYAQPHYYSRATVEAAMQCEFQVFHD